jgi:L-ascorbate metabolism protein UlaG (beta-lactamase superfamily)
MCPGISGALRASIGAVTSRQSRYYLRANVAVEPLVDRWYAWSHLIAPATAARNLTHRHLPIMDSYAEVPQAHMAASANPKLLGGPFVNFLTDRSEEAAGLAAATRRKRNALIELSAAIGQLDLLLSERADGHSLETLYCSIPEALRGYVELFYDRGHRASFRFIEPLMYRSSYYQPDAQSLMLRRVDSDDRPFIFSTPRLDSGDSVHWTVPFSEGRVDALFKLRSQPASLASVMDLVEGWDDDAALLTSFMTDEAPSHGAKYDRTGFRWRYFGHATVLIESRDCAIITDPVIAYPFARMSPRYSFDDLPEWIDFVLITHGHQDHLLLETLLQIRERIGTIVVAPNNGGTLEDPSLALILRTCGFPRVRELAECEQIDFADGSITAIPFLGEHCDLNIRSKSAYLVRIGQRCVLFAADSRNLDPMLYDHVRQVVGRVDTLFVGMECDGAPLSWIYGPLLAANPAHSINQSRRAAGSDFSGAVAMVDSLGCSEVYVYAMGQEPWLQFISSIRYSDDSSPIVQSNLLLAAARERGLRAERLSGCKEVVRS